MTSKIQMPSAFQMMTVTPGSELRGRGTVRVPRVEQSAKGSAAVCPRCLDLEPGVPGGDPEQPHPGPFTEELCKACEQATT